MKDLSNLSDMFLKKVAAEVYFLTIRLLASAWERSSMPSRMVLSLPVSAYKDCRALDPLISGRPSFLQARPS